MGRHVKDLSGMKFGRLLVLRIVRRDRHGKPVSLCHCECGTKKEVLNESLKKGNTKSCGCLIRDVMTAKRGKDHPRFKHGMKGSITYNSWNGMIRRCTDPSFSGYRNYGGKGITVCKRWSDSEKGLLNFVEDMGHRPSLKYSIDRIKGMKGYKPGNCRWATRSQQNQNVSRKKSNSTGYKGIQQHKSKNRWAADIRSDGTRYYLGLYRTKVGAALAYNIASEILQGEFGSRNELPPVSDRTLRIVTARVRSKLKLKEN